MGINITIFTFIELKCYWERWSRSEQIPTNYSCGTCPREEIQDTKQSC